ncbi:hypothetical protein ACFSQ7_45110 [Paenibacillus rhizoplanae]
MLHGEAVAVGLVIQAKLGVKFGYMTEEEANRVVALLKKAGLPTELPEYISNRALVDKMYTDKKSTQRPHPLRLPGRHREDEAFR